MPSKRRKLNLRRFLGVLFLSSLTISLWLGYPALSQQTGFGVIAQIDAQQLVEQGINRYQGGDYNGAIASWQKALNSYPNRSQQAAIVQENIARAYQEIGESGQALKYWESAIAYYQNRDKKQVGRLKIEQAQSYNSLGQPKSAIALLCGTTEQACVSDSALQIARTYKDSNLEAAALGSLGEAYRFTGDYQKAITYLQASLQIARETNNSVYHTAALNGLGNAYTSLASVNYRREQSALARGDRDFAAKFRKLATDYDTKALEYFQNSIERSRIANDLNGELRALLNAIILLQRTQAPISTAVTQAKSLLERLPDSRAKAYAAITLADFGLENKNTKKLDFQCPLEIHSEAEELLHKAILIARNIQDNRAESFALGKLGHLYECRQDYAQALNLTRQAELAAQQNLTAKDSLYLWEWQTGRILKAQNQNNDAIAAYERAVTTLDDIRSDILTEDRDLQFDFRDTVEPIYRELAQLRLESIAPVATKAATKAQEYNQNLNLVLKTIDSLKLAELQNYFGNNCVVTPVNEDIAKVGSQTATAVFNSIVFGDRTAIIVSLPQGGKSYTWIDVDSATLRQKINEYRRGLERFRDYVYDPQLAQQLYDWIVRPFASELEQAQIKTLVFVQDGILRSVPMAALYDGKKYLIQNYALATTPSLTLTEPKSLNRNKLRALILGLTRNATVDERNYPALINVGSELQEVEMLIPGSKQLVDHNFTSDRLRQELDKTRYPIIHIATHGEFGTVPEDTFLVTGNNTKLTIDDLNNIIRGITRGAASVELLTLTACQTAVGDDRAALGLAGVAVQAGVKSALASLWFIQDASTVTLVTKFYEGLRAGTSKAEALRSAQQALIASGEEYTHPAYWAPFILIGNWL